MFLFVLIEFNFDRPSDTTVSAVASNNIVSIRKDKDLFDSLKRLRNISDDTVEKLTAQQREAIFSNHTLLLCLMNKVIVVF